MRTAPKVKPSDRPYDCAFLVSGYDTIEESASVFIFEETWARLENAKACAKEKNNGSNQAYGFYHDEDGVVHDLDIGGIKFQIKPHGGEGVAFILSNELFTVAIRPAKIAYNLSVKFRSRTLWEYGPEQARKMIWDALLREMKPRRPNGEGNPDAEPTDWRRLSRADFAFDFHAPGMTDEIGPEMIDRLVCHSSSKPRWDFKVKADSGDELDAYVMGTSRRIQTMTVGKKDALQMQLYKKSDEITEKSQKTWMYKLWEKAGLDSSQGHNDVWRIELRFGREYLAARGIDTFEYFDFHRENLLCEALKTRRLTDPTDDTNRRRWPMHPMWGKAVDMAGNAMVMLSLEGHKEQAADAILENIKQNMKAALRRHNVLATGGADYDWGTAFNFLQEILNETEEDENHREKMEEYGERYRHIREPI